MDPPAFTMPSSSSLVWCDLSNKMIVKHFVDTRERVIIICTQLNLVWGEPPLPSRVSMLDQNSFPKCTGKLINCESSLRIVGPPF